MTCSKGLRSTCVRLLTLMSVLLTLGAASATAEMQRLSLQPGWNLISFAVVPVDPQPTTIFSPLIEADNFDALWEYDAAGGVWRSFPAQAPGTPVIDQIENGVGYWLRVRRAANFDVDGVMGAFSAGPSDLEAGWNLVGFPVEEPTPYERVLTNVAIRQVWTFDANAGEFRGVVLDPQGLVTREDFIDLLPGRGYWLLAREAISVAPVLGTGLPPDLDVPPLLDNPSTEVGVPFAQLTAGDVDIGRDGFYDRTASQRAIDFGDRQELQPLSIFNTGSGILAWRVTVVNPDEVSWLRISIPAPDGGAPTLFTEESETAASETDIVNLVVDRTGLAPGDYTANVMITTNGAPMASPDEASRMIQVNMSVAGLEGDYRLLVELERVNGRRADLPNPRIGLSLYNDPNGLKAIVSEGVTLLIPQRLRLFGDIIESGTTRFEVSGSFSLPEGHPANPYSTDVRRDITIRAQRRDPLDPRDLILGPLDLRGEYFETVRNVTAEPIYIVGSFIGERLGGSGNLRDIEQPENRTSRDIPDDGVLEQTVEVTQRILINELDVTVNLVHTRPSDLVVTLIAPDDTEAILRSRSNANVGRVTYDDFADPLDDLAIFDGKLAPGTWTLRVEDEVPGETGTLLNWDILVAGTEVYDVGGNVGENVPEGSVVVLTGCGVSAVARTDADGNFRFTDLIDCIYRVNLLQPGFSAPSTEVILSGADILDLMFDPIAVDPRLPIIPGNPSSPDACSAAQPSTGCAFFALTTAGGAGALLPRTPLRYVLDATTFDVDRPPLDNPGGPGLEDTNEFLDVVDELTMSNVVGLNGRIDGPAGPNSARVTVNLGQPVIGTSVQGNLRLSIGANP